MRQFLNQNKRVLALLVVLSILLSTVVPNNIKLAFASNENDAATASDAELITEDASEQIVEKMSVTEESPDDTEVTEDEETDEKEDEAKTLHASVPDSDAKITINAPAGSLPYPEEEISVDARELVPGSAEYDDYLSQAAAALNMDGAAEISFARFFDIEILHNGEKVEPNSPVEVKIEYDEAPEIPDGSDLSVVHFAEEGTEVIDDVDLNKDATEIVYEQESFSITATIVSVPSAPAATSEGRYYALVAKDMGNGKVYAVMGNGSVQEVASFTEDGGSVKTVTMDSPMMWTYVSMDGNNYIRYASEGYDYGTDQQAHTFAYTYIDPVNVNGISSDVPKTDGEGNVIKEGNTTQFDSPKGHCNIVLDDQAHIYHLEGGAYSFVALDDSGSKLVGGLSPFESEQLNQINNTSFYLAEVQSLIDPASGNGYKMARYHQVNHIDISIEDKVSVDIPLAYGTYYDSTGKPVLVIDENSSDADKNLSVSQNVAVSQEHLRKAKIQAFAGSTELNDAFYVSGYSSNDETQYSTSQVRIEGVFKVANVAPIPDSYADWQVNSDQFKAERLANIITYKVTAVEPDVEFFYIHPTYGQLYSSSGRKLSVTSDVTVSATFDYFDEHNECPPIQNPNDGTENDPEPSYGMRVYLNWRSGGILNTGTSGMDFKLDGNSTVDIKPVAIEIKKIIQDDSGNPIIPAEPINDISFDVYENAGGDPDSAINLNVGHMIHRLTTVAIPMLAVIRLIFLMMRMTVE